MTRCIFLAWLLLLWPCSVLAQQSPQSRAEEAFQRGVRSFAAGDYATAGQQFLTAAALSPTAAAWRNVGASMFELSQPVEAIVAYERSLTLRGEPRNARERAEVQEVRGRLAELRPQVAWLTVTTNTEGAEIRTCSWDFVGVQIGPPFPLQVGRACSVTVSREGCGLAQTTVTPTIPGPIQITLWPACSPPHIVTPRQSPTPSPGATDAPLGADPSRRETSPRPNLDLRAHVPAGSEAERRDAEQPPARTASRSSSSLVPLAIGGAVATVAIAVGIVLLTSGGADEQEIVDWDVRLR